MSVKSERKLVIESGSPLTKHSLNQKAIKRSLEGENRLGIFPQRTTSQIREIFAKLENDEIFSRLLARVEKLEETNATIPKRLGQIALTVTSLINYELKSNPQNYEKDWVNIPRYKFRAGSQFSNLIPKQLMVANYLRETGQIPPKPQTVKNTTKSADIFAYNVGGLIFNEGGDVTTVCAIIAMTNLLRHFAREIKEGRLTVIQARKMVVVFGETTARFLVKL